jgi:FixJ family two-component response regulator
MGIDIPIIFITGQGDIPMAVQAMKAGAIEFLVKPFEDQGLLDAIQQALGRDRASRKSKADAAEMKGRFQSLTRREREVMLYVTDGMLNKQIAAKLGTSEVTIKLHRASVMRKMRAGSVAELVKTATRLGITIRK